MPSSEVMGKYKRGRLRSGSKRGPIVKSRAQAVAIMLSERRNEQETGSADRPKRLSKPRRSRA